MPAGKRDRQTCRAKGAPWVGRQCLPAGFGLCLAGQSCSASALPEQARSKLPGLRPLAANIHTGGAPTCRSACTFLRLDVPRNEMTTCSRAGARCTLAKAPPSRTSYRCTAGGTAVYEAYRQGGPCRSGLLSSRCLATLLWQGGGPHRIVVPPHAALGVEALLPKHLRQRGAEEREGASGRDRLNRRCVDARRGAGRSQLSGLRSEGEAQSESERSQSARCRPHPTSKCSKS